MMMGNETEKLSLKHPWIQSLLTMLRLAKVRNTSQRSRDLFGSFIESHENAAL
ncbi:hypothetical protein E4U21_003849 [Claviceps maximensis]|nr:hypothetical protein E4U21_003849 [Claviceps maximensis]